MIHEEIKHTGFYDIAVDKIDLWVCQKAIATHSSK